MTHEGRQLLYRIQIRCAQEWGTVRYDAENDVHLFWAPFGVQCWYLALDVCENLLRGEKYER